MVDKKKKKNQAEVTESPPQCHTVSSIVIINENVGILKLRSCEGRSRGPDAEAGNTMLSTVPEFVLERHRL